MPKNLPTWSCFLFGRGLLITGTAINVDGGMCPVV